MSAAGTAASTLTGAKKIVPVAFAVCIPVTITILQDALEARNQQSSFYFSESFLFSSFWLLFAPGLYLQYRFIQNKVTTPRFVQPIILLVPAFSHLVLYPGLVLIMSAVFYQHTFRYQQTLQYSLGEHLFPLLFFYCIPVYSWLWFSKRNQQKEDARLVSPENQTNRKPLQTLLVTEANRRTCIAVADIFYCTANPPYINIFLTDKKILHSETLKSMQEKLHNDLFIRIHKSTLVNIFYVISYTSRLNGDYDIQLVNGSQLRVSRNFAADFKAAFAKCHPDSIK